MADLSRRIDLSLNWKPETDLTVVQADDDLSSPHALLGGGVKVRVMPIGESWPVREVKDALKVGRATLWLHGITRAVGPSERQHDLTARRARSAKGRGAATTPGKRRSSRERERKRPQAPPAASIRYHEIVLKCLPVQ
ncbi:MULTISPECIES: hypothetical protein [unclassified Bradyrhizobium]|uniref:hypothetical protein n=1 Tax=unclassified Bradyrhizobium TaxID=2631580 RepID=UPI00247964B8|nr:MULTISPECIES: hypothetical protein [unclassified Bradyrhizobium]WGR72644.1 hypothetical protein MTX24_06825 [Bradyrhizobium sp. ISRA426]WGR77477.1 hypothetical protein MTX21_31775 [Bradyrhizobium sp. ISRA430]WGR87883.1 hypothetical protein MTX25_06825 [Bradyrhizobium sp. ISRA432]